RYSLRMGCIAKDGVHAEEMPLRPPRLLIMRTRRYGYLRHGGDACRAAFAQPSSAAVNHIPQSFEETSACIRQRCRPHWKPLVQISKVFNTEHRFYMAL